MQGLRKDGPHCDEIRRNLKEIDPLFEVEFNYSTACYHITFNAGVFETVPFDDMDRHWVQRTKETYWLNTTGQIIDYVDSKNDAIEAEKDRKLADMTLDMAEQMRKPLIETHYYGG